MNRPISMDKPDYLLGDEMRCGDCGQPSLEVDADTIARCKNPDCPRNKLKPAV
jgi:hypothetical protein